MILKKAINRLAWRFTSKKRFTPNDDDIRALNDVITWINNQKREVVLNNQLFAKLYIYFLNQKIKEHGTTVFDELPQKELSKLLDRPLEMFYQAFQESFNENMREQIMKKNGISLEFNSTPQSRAEDQLRIKNMSKEDQLKLITDIYDLPTIETELNEMVSEALNRFS